AASHAPARRVGARASDVGQCPLRIDLRASELRFGLPGRAIVPRHLLALDHARRIRPGSNRSWPAMLGIAVRVRATAEAVALDDALEAAPLARSGHLHRIARREDPHRHRVAEVEGGDLRTLSHCLIETEASDR